MNKAVLGHALAVFTVVVWGTTFIATKLLLVDFNPAEIMLIRYFLAFLVLSVACPKPLKLQKRSHEWLFVGAGLSGVALYQLLENTSLTYSTASNVSLIISTTPLLTALLAMWLLPSEKPRPTFFLGFAVAIAGLVLVTFNGAFILKLSPLGDLMAVGGALCWSCYSILLRKIGDCGYSSIVVTRRIFFYGTLFTLPTLFLFDSSNDFARFAKPENLLCLLFLGLIASAVCFVAWNHAIKLLGAVKSSSYIYGVPVVTMAASALVLHEQISVLMLAGAALTVSGLILSELKFHKKEKIA